MRDDKGKSALFQSVQKCNPRILAVLLLHPDRDIILLNKRGIPATWKFSDDTVSSAKSLNWVWILSSM
jgi:hypothetical protein